MIKLATVMNHQLKKLDLINKWEEKTGLHYNASSYQIVLSTGMDNGPTGKSLGYEKEWCYYGENQTQLIQRICQDAGRRLLVNVCNKKYLEYNPLLCYKVYEELNEYLTGKILEEVSWNSNKLSAMSEQTDLYDIFDSIFSTDPEIKTVDLYAIALDKYSQVYSITSL